MKYWARQRKRNEDGPTVFCPVVDGCLITGMNIIADECPGKLVGEFWYDSKGEFNFEMKEDESE